MNRTSLALWAYLMSDCILFATLFATYAVLHTRTAGAPGPQELFDRAFVLKETIILLTSSFTCGLALIAVRNRQRILTWTLLLSTLFLGVAFLHLEFTEFAKFIAAGNSWQASAFLSSFFTLVGTHGLHVLIGALWLVGLLIYLAVRGIDERFERRLYLFSLFWHFLDIVWICVFSIVYLLGTL